jgi:hypothetical protein
MSLPRIEDVHDDVTLDHRMAAASPAIRSLVDRVLEDGTLSIDEAIQLLESDGDDVLAIIAAADAIRKTDVGEDVTYVVNRNVNFTNVCFVGCRFCAFKRQRWEPDAYNQSVETILAKVQEGVDRGATEICMQGGINPEMPPFTYRDILIAIKQAFPAIHMHAFSPMEVMYGARRTNMSYEDYLAMLKGDLLAVFRGAGELHPARLAAAAGVDLGLHHHREAHLLARLDGFRDGVGDLAVGHGHAMVGKDGLALVLVDLQSVVLRDAFERGIVWCFRLPADADVSLDDGHGPEGRPPQGTGIHPDPPVEAIVELRSAESPPEDRGQARDVGEADHEVDGDLGFVVGDHRQPQGEVHRGGAGAVEEEIAHQGRQPQAERVRVQHPGVDADGGPAQRLVAAGPAKDDLRLPPFDRGEARRLHETAEAAERCAPGVECGEDRQAGDP